MLCIPKEVSDYHLSFIFRSLGGEEEDDVRLKFPPLLTKVPTTKNIQTANSKAFKTKLDLLRSLVFMEDR